MKKRLLPLLLAAWANFCIHAAQEGAPEKTGISVGEKAPAFTLKNQSSQEVSLNSLLKSGPVALVFYRSADW